MPAKLQSLGRCEALAKSFVSWSHPQCLRTAYHHKTIGGRLVPLCSQHARMRSDRLRLVQPAEISRSDRQ